MPVNIQAYNKNPHFGDFQEMLKASIPLVVRQKQLQQQQQQHESYMNQRKAELLEESNKSKMQLAATTAQNQADNLFDMVRLGHETENQKVVQSLSPLVERLSASAGNPITLPKDEDGNYIVMNKPTVGEDGKNSTAFNDLRDVLGRDPTLDELYNHMRADNQPVSPSFQPIQTSEGWKVVDRRAGTAKPLLGQGNRPVLPVAADVDLAGNKKRAEVSATKDEELKAQRKEEYPKVRSAWEASERQFDILDGKIAKAIDMITPFNAGWGAYLASLPASEAKTLKETLETIKANIGFDKLQEMRSASKTGGALGQVSEFENKLLQAVKGSLDQFQSSDEIKNNLQIIRDNLRMAREYNKTMIKVDYGEYMESKGTAADYLKKKGF